MDILKSKQLLLAENPQPKPGVRIQNLDLLKLISLVLILCLHCTFAYDKGQLGFFSVSRFLYCMGGFAIPMFFAVSGYQLLGKTNGNYRYILRKIGRMLVATFLFYVVVKASYRCCFGTPFIYHGRNPILDYLLSLLFLGDFNLIWFIGGLILVYLFYPLVNRLYLRRRGWFIGLYAGLLTFQTVVFIITITLQTDSWLFEYEIPQTFRLWNWLGYFCLGGLIRRYAIFNRLAKLPLLLVMLVVGYVVMTLVTWRIGIWWCEYSYASLPVILGVATLFAYVMKFKFNSRFLAAMVGVFFPAYLVGDFYVTLIKDAFDWLPTYLAPIVYVAVTAVCSVTTGWLLVQIPFVRKFLTF